MHKRTKGKEGLLLDLDLLRYIIIIMLLYYYQASKLAIEISII